MLFLRSHPIIKTLIRVVFLVFLASTSTHALESSWSSSKQFRVFSENPKLRSLFCKKADEYRDQFHRFTELPKIESLIIIKIHPKGINFSTPVTSHIRRFSADSHHLQLDVHLKTSFLWEDLGREITEMLLALQVLDNENNVITSNLTPWWIKEGIWQNMLTRERGRTTEEFQFVIKAGKQLSIEKILTARSSTLDSSELDKISSEAFVRSLLTETKGKKSLTNFVQEFPLGERPVLPILKKHWPSLQKTKQETEHWWAIKARVLVEPSPFDVMSLEKSNSVIGNALWFPNYLFNSDSDFTAKPTKKKILGVLPVSSRNSAQDKLPLRKRFKFGKKKPTDPEKKLIHISEIKEIIKHEDREKIMEQAMSRFVRTTQFIHPLYRPVAENYLTVMSSLRNGKKNNIPSELEKLELERKNIADKMLAIDSYLDWIEVTGKQNERDGFNQYLRLIRSSKKPPTKRKDPISEYLDAIQRELESL